MWKKNECMLYFIVVHYVLVGLIDYKRLKEGEGDREGRPYVCTDVGATFTVALYFTVTLEGLTTPSV